LQHCLDVLEEANQIALRKNPDELIEQMLALILRVLQARGGALYLFDRTRHDLSLKVALGLDHSCFLPRLSLADTHEQLHHLFFDDEPLFVPDLRDDPYWLEQRVRPTTEVHALPDDAHSLCYLPILLRQHPVGLIEAVGLAPTSSSELNDQLAIVRMLLNRLMSEIEKAMLLHASMQHEHQQQSLIDFISQITATLERNEMVHLILHYAEQLLDVEATSFWLIDEKEDRLRLLVAAGDSRESVEEVSVAMGEGIIGHVVQTGTMMCVDDVSTEPRFTNRIDSQSGFITRSVLCVPMRAPRIVRGDLRGEIKETIIGGAQALNKRDGSPFSKEDVRHFETLTRQAALAFQLSNLFEESNTLLWGVIRATTSAIDFTDPYARGHSQRVSDFSVAIAEEMGLSPEEVFRVRIGSMLHDIGKIGVSDVILRKPGRLTEGEYDEIRRHPSYGVELLQEAGLGDLLHEELKALAEHHERLDGRGYPKGLYSEEISRIGRIVAVADVFDALTSDRPYRAALSVEEAFGMLRDGSGKELDVTCVEALICAREKDDTRPAGQRRIQVQNERPPVPTREEVFKSASLPQPQAGG
jgi:HD-GYP domain-containing protein (c-di-GMP phosphodiesterase class II)